jgi:hypothetical protein
MPVILLSCDAPNQNIHELFEMDRFDYVYMEQSPAAEDLHDLLSNHVPSDRAVYCPDLNTDNFGTEKMKSLFRRFDDVKSGNVLIISHQSFFQALGLDVAEWQPLAFKSF